MKNYLKLLAWALTCLLCLHTQAQTPEYVPGQVIIKMKPGKSAAQKTALKTQLKANTQKTFSSLHIELWQINESQQKADIDQIIRDYANHPDIEYIEPNYIFHLATDCPAEASVVENSPPFTPCPDNTAHDFPKREWLPLGSRRGMANLTTTPNDPLFNDQWNLHNTGQYGAPPDTDINAPEAWDIANSSPDIQIAILDTGVDWKHEDLIDNIWQNLGEDFDGDGRVLEFIGGEWVFDPDDENGIDDDSTGYADDFIGWDFRDNDNDPIHDLSGNLRWHGTHIAGIAGASGNNGTGISGVTWTVEIPVLKIFRGNGSASQSRIIEAIEYATLMNFPILNNSWGRELSSPPMGIQDAMQAAAANGQVLITAAGNNGTNNDINSAFYPASLDIDNIISVASIDRNNALATNSNYGATTVDLAAPGVDILSCFPMNSYGSGSGTSQAAPHVSAACALLLQQDSMATPAEIKAAIINSATVTPALTGNCLSDGRLNLSGALTYSEGDTTTVSLSCRERDSLALVALYNATDGANWINTWDLNQPMDGWYGIQLDENGCVSCIDMDGDFDCVHDYNNSGNNLVGNIPPDIENLNDLIFLDLSFNNISGGIPTEIEGMNKLTHMNLSNNPLGGSIPQELGSLSELTYLNLEYDQLSGVLPIELFGLYELREGEKNNLPI